MPKIVDHEERRAEIVAATMRVIERLGLDGATVREIALEAGLSRSVLAHYFANKAQILVTAHHTAFAAVRDRIEAKRREIGDPVELLRVALEEAMPIDARRMLEANIDVAFWEFARHDPELRAIRLRSHLDAVEMWTAAAREVQAAGSARAGIDVEGFGVETQLVIDGVSLQAVLFPEAMTPDRQLAVVATHLGRILRQ